MIGKNVGERLLGKLPTYAQKLEEEGRQQKTTRQMCGRTFIINCYYGHLDEDGIQAVRKSFEDCFYTSGLDDYKKGMGIIHRVGNVLETMYGKSCSVTLNPKEEWRQLEFDIVFGC